MWHLSQLFIRLLDVLAPPQCAACDAAVASSSAFCEACRLPVCHAARRELCGVPLIVAGRYAAPLSTAIVRFKYGGRGELSRPLARLLVPALGQLELAKSAALVPVPLHRRRLAERGYNQAALLAEELARALGRRCLSRLLARTRDMDHQVGKARAERLRNAREAFTLRAATAREVVLVDDVVTTGATVRACAQALARGGVRLAGVVALAQTDGAIRDGAAASETDGRPRG
jgi:ComF family protein